MSARAGLATLALILVPMSALSAQGVVRGFVVAAETGAPIADARIVSTSTGIIVSTDQQGRFTILSRLPNDSLSLSAIGRAPTGIRLDGFPVAPIRIAMTAATVRLTDLVVSAPPGAPSPLGDSWRVPRTTLREAPIAIEPDVFRGLSVVPAVTYSSPLSARPLLRGYSADDGALRIDGFEVLNLYHLGRAFSAFPADAAEAVIVTPGTESVSKSASLSGAVDIEGRAGSREDGPGGLALSMASLSGWLDGGTQQRWFVAGRAVHLSVLDAVSGDAVPYDFQDGYGSLLIGTKHAPAAQVTVFGAQDDFFDEGTSTGQRWSNLLLGGSATILNAGALSVHGSLSATRFREEVEDVQARSSRLDVENEFSRFGATMEGEILTGAGRWRLGAALASRDVRNVIIPREGSDFTARNASVRRPELSAFAEWEGHVAGFDASAGIRGDAAGDAFILQPRVQFRRQISPQVELGFSLGRSGRLFQLVSDQAPEPDVTFYDFWLDAGADDVPTPRIDHLALDIQLKGKTNLRASLYGSRGTNMGELRPASDQSQASTVSPFRFGRSRTGGIELQAGWAAPESQFSATATYVLAVSERDWGSGWVPWLLDRRHMLRLATRVSVLPGVRASAAFEAMSGAPITPVDQVILVGLPDPGGDGVDRGPGRVAYLYGAEGSARGAGTARLDLGLGYGFTGPWKSRCELAFSIINVGFGPVAFERPVDPNSVYAELVSTGSAMVSYERAYDLPAIPSVTFRMEF